MELSRAFGTKCLWFVGMTLLVPRLEAQTVSIPAATASPVTLARTAQYDLPSRITGRMYRIKLAFPASMSPDSVYPPLFVLDGNYYFGTITEAMTRQAIQRDISPAIIVTVGYPTDDWSVVRTTRYLDLTPSRGRDPQMPPTGEADLFLRFLEEELKPFVRSHYRLDWAHQAIWGHSIGGLTVLRSFLRNPGNYATYIISSPSIWYNDKEVLADTAQFATRLGAVSARLKVLVASAADEQYRGPDPKLLALAADRMVDNASDFATWLNAHTGEHLAVTRIIFPDETHTTASSVSLARSLRFAFPGAR